MTHSDSSTLRTVPTPRLLSLKQVAKWDLEYLETPESEITASVPPLQRGLVWSPQQVEILWDSILRGFPIGSLVIAPQKESAQQKTATHHLIDGQQRTNAITLGFHDPFSKACHQVRNNKSESILWIDLAPSGTKAFPVEQIPSNSTREFLTRVTTSAHPWGYNPDDRASRLSASCVREAISWETHTAETRQQRLSTCDLFPWKSNAPIPMSWLLNADPDDPATFWGIISQRLKEENRHHRWPKLALDYIKQEASIDQLQPILDAVLRVIHTQIVVINTPSNLIATSRQEKNEHPDKTEDISNIEHLFNRLNRQGSPLDGEELAYSMIKAYWPEAANVIDSVKSLRFPPSHLISIGVRAALTPAGSDQFPRGIGIPRLRTIATTALSVEGKELSANQTARQLIEELFESSGAEPSNTRIAKACALVDSWLIYDRQNAINGLPPVLLSSFARSSSEIYLFIFYVADRLRDETALDPEWNQLFKTIATLCHWFTIEHKKYVADTLLASIAEGISPSAVRQGLINVVTDGLVYLPKPPEELYEFIELPSEGNLQNWRWWNTLIHTPENEEATQQNNVEWGSTIYRTKENRELLLYAQRAYLDRRFPDYDPSRKDLWESHNRPWDFDHIHASAYFHNKSGEFANVCRQWGNCIGNLRAWPFEENRSDQKDAAKKKFRPEQLADCLLTSETELDAFSYEDSTRHDPEKAHQLCLAIKERYIRIYTSWYDAVEIEKLREIITTSKSKPEEPNN